MFQDTSINHLNTSSKIKGHYCNLREGKGEMSETYP